MRRIVREQRQGYITTVCQFRNQAQTHRVEVFLDVLAKHVFSCTCIRCLSFRRAAACPDAEPHALSEAAGGSGSAVAKRCAGATAPAAEQLHVSGHDQIPAPAALHQPAPKPSLLLQPPHTPTPLYPIPPPPPPPPHTPPT